MYRIEISDVEITSKVTNHPLKGDKKWSQIFGLQPLSGAANTKINKHRDGGNPATPCPTLTLCQISQWQSEHWILFSLLVSLPLSCRMRLITPLPAIRPVSGVLCKLSCLLGNIKTNLSNSVPFFFCMSRMGQAKVFLPLPHNSYSSCRCNAGWFERVKQSGARWRLETWTDGHPGASGTGLGSLKLLSSVPNYVRVYSVAV